LKTTSSFRFASIHNATTTTAVGTRMDACWHDWSCQGIVPCAMRHKSHVHESWRF
jgi:hypothetical protein